MKVLNHELGQIHVPGEHDSLDKLYRLAQRGVTWAADTETTGLNQFRWDFNVRIVQVGTTDEAWILRPEWHMEAIARLTTMDDTWWHNFVYDCISMQTSLKLPFAVSAGGALDTETCSRLLDPRGRDKGGVGHRLEDLSRHYVGTESKKEAKTALLEEARRLGIKTTAARIFKDIPVDNDVYHLYAGQDVFLTARIAEALWPLICARNLERFFAFEMPLTRRLAQMQIIGMAFDEAWAEDAEARYDMLLDDAETQLKVKWGIEQTATYAHTSKKSLIAAFEREGVQWRKFSEKTGAVSLDAGVLDELAGGTGDVAELARDVLVAKRNKRLGDYIRGMLAEVGADGRIHPNIRPMQAATARMSISNPPIQQFPRGDKTIRGCLVADPGHVIISVDYSQIEFRVAAGVSGDPQMIEDILSGADIHATTADALFGKAWTAEQRSVGKGITFGWIYLGSDRGIHEAVVSSYPELAPTLKAVSRATRALAGRYKHYKRWGVAEQRSVKAGNTTIFTATGRPLICEKPWAAVNYKIQSPARDIFAAGVNEIHRRGYGDYLRLVVHDEVVLSAPKEEAEEVLAGVVASMTTRFRGVPIAAEGGIKGDRWTK